MTETKPPAVDKGPNVRARVAEDLKTAAAAVLAAQGRTITDVIEDALAKVVAETPTTGRRLDAFEASRARARELAVQARELVEGWTRADGLTAEQYLAIRDARGHLIDAAQSIADATGASNG